MLSRSICQTASFRDPAVVDLDGLELQPLGIGVDRVDDAAADPGVSAPISRWCAVVAAKATSVPSWNTGTTKATSGPWLAPA